VLAWGLAAGLAVEACSGGGVSPPRAGGDVAPAAGELPAEALGTQRLYRAAYGGPEGDGSFRATLRLVAPERFDLRIADRLGRPLWTLRVEGAGGWWQDHRREVACRDLGALVLPGLAGAPVEARALPRLLLGLLPVDAEASGEASPGDAGGEVELRDAQGRVWTVASAGGRPERWTLADADGPLWWWRRDGRGGVLSGRQGRQLRWQEAVVEPLAGLPAAALPGGVREDCSPPQPD
jgi:hypothetical protein